ncbi:MAG: hypothetical protein LM564_03330 [Desulfurococcaceae archaeon]|nr:hypothetical protein [Desulfurococcaceae archaeon]
MSGSQVLRFTLLYTGLVALFNSTLLLLGERRVDAYVAVNVLSFYVSYSLARPPTRPGVATVVLHVLLLTVFAVVVALRVYEVLVG